MKHRNLAFFALGIGVVLVVGATKTILDLNLNTTPGNATVIEIQDPNATPQSGRFLLTNLVRVADPLVVTSKLPDNATNVAMVIQTKSEWTDALAQMLKILNSTNVAVRVFADGSVYVGKSAKEQNDPSLDGAKRDIAVERDISLGETLQAGFIFEQIDSSDYNFSSTIAGSAKASSTTSRADFRVGWEVSGVDSCTLQLTQNQEDLANRRLHWEWWNGDAIDFLPGRRQDANGAKLFRFNAPNGTTNTTQLLLSVDNANTPMFRVSGITG